MFSTLISFAALAIVIIVVIAVLPSIFSNPFKKFDRRWR